jgi:hypothetical protein
MSASTHEASAIAGASLAPARTGGPRARSRRRAMVIVGAVALGSFALFVDLLLVGHTVGEEIWGPVTAITGTVVGILSLAYLTVRSRSRAARIALYGLWALVAFFGFGGYNDHRLPQPADTITDQRERPPLAPLAFTGLAVAGAVALRNGSKGA